ncbi:hypothetical protein ABT404_18945 [Streptomyces hyaluromycini]|uniref:Secreted protein n=1 Tax=Streptomyces hyaluromycini TaxID=1377993 RepID=A0ABV1WXM4_9ACTN
MVVVWGDVSWGSVLSGLCAAVLCEELYGPFGGLLEGVCVDCGRDFLSWRVTVAFAVLGVVVEDLPACTPHLKGVVEGLSRVVEGLSRVVEGMFLAGLPGCVRRPCPGKRASCPMDEVLLGFEDFTARLLEWTSWWIAEPPPT